MRKLNESVLVCIVILQFFSSILAYREWWENSNVFDLTTENFFDHVGKDKYVVVKFFTKWCGYCRIMSPEYDKLVDTMKEKRDDVLVARLEGGMNEDITMIYEIFSFPKIVLFYPGSVDVRSSFRGQRIAPVMQAWIEQNAPRLEKKLKYLDSEKEEKRGKEKEREKERIRDPETQNNRKAINKTKTYDLEDAIDNAKNQNFTGEIEFLKIELSNMKNRVVNLEKDLEEFKNYTRSLAITGFETNIQQETEQGDNEENKEDVAKKLKMIKDKKKKGEGFFDKMTSFDLIIYGGIILLLIGTIITVKKIVFKKAKSLLNSEHEKV